ncbi:MAG: class I SAM-dependent methyltransferase [Pseudomonadota bacterium]
MSLTSFTRAVPSTHHDYCANAQLTKRLALDFIHELKHVIDVDGRAFGFPKQMRKGRTLLVGEGDLSFSLSLIRSRTIDAKSLVATTLQPAARLPRAGVKNASQLRTAGTRVQHNVDARKLNESFSKNLFQTVIFNFPNVGSRQPNYGRNPNHDLVRAFLQSSNDVLTTGARVLITSVDSPHYRGVFQFPLAAEKTRFEIERIHRFYPTAFRGYTHINTNDEESAVSEHAKFCTWVFKQK